MSDYDLDAIASPHQQDYDSIGGCVCGESFPCTTLGLVAEVGRLVDELTEARKVIDAARTARDTPITADPDDTTLAAVVEHLRPLYAAVSRWDTLQAIRHVTAADQGEPT